MTGGCLCGAVRYEIEGAPQFVGKCYCNDCKKETGTGHNTVVAVSDAALHLTGALTKFARRGDSGAEVVRSFCPICGTTVFGCPSAMPGVSMVRAGTLDNPASITPMMAIYGSRAVHWDQPPAGLQVFAEMPQRG
jgi:hypothetical protein